MQRVHEAHDKMELNDLYKFKYEEGFKQSTTTKDSHLQEVPLKIQRCEKHTSFHTRKEQCDASSPSEIISLFSLKVQIPIMIVG